MKKLFSILFALLLVPGMMMAQGWPANYKGVMLQGFYWDSYDDSSWSVLTSQADELASAFDLIWIPQSANCGGTSMGYDPLYWFPGHYNSSFGTEQELRTMIQTFKNKGLKTIGDVVVNHRKNVSNWVDFPKETYNGADYQLLSTDICKDDDGGATLTWANNNGYSLSANNDTGEGWSGMRDLDHQSTNVQENVKAYVKMLIDEFGYAGFRYDMVKGYSASYTKLYNEYANPEFSIGEYWDGSTAIKKWINETGKTSAAFDFQFKYVVRNATDKNDWSYLGKQNDGNWPLIDSQVGDYKQYAITFVENHDTEVRHDGSSNGPIRKDTLAANAYLLAMPGTPCVFMTHWLAYRNDIKSMIDVRKVAGINNMSDYSNMRSSQTYYANLIKNGADDALMVVVGSDLNGYIPSASQWTKVLTGYHYAYYLPNTMEIAWADKASGTYETIDDYLKVKLTAVSSDSNAQLVLTTDGSEPTADSSTYPSGSNIFVPVGTTTLKVGLLLNGTVSKVIMRTYTVKEVEEFVIPDFCIANEGETCAFFEAPASWTSTIKCWAWGAGGSPNYTGGTWPGADCVKVGTRDGNAVYKWTYDGTLTTKPAFIIFSNNGSPKTDDLTFTNAGYYNKQGLLGVVTPTGINNINHETTSNNYWYTLDGRKLDKMPTTKGIYITNGVKVVIK